MATGPLRFRTPHIEELPIDGKTRQAPGFAWVAVSGPSEDPSKNWGTSNRKRARVSAAGQTESQREALSARQQRDIERKIRELNSDNSKDVQIPVPTKGAGGGHRAGKTTNTKKILASGKTFAHYLDDEEAEIARTGRRDGDLEVVPSASIPQRASKTPIARRGLMKENSTDISPASTHSASKTIDDAQAPDVMDVDQPEEEPDSDLPSKEEIQALLDAPPLTYNQARSAPPPADTPPPRRFCEVCGYFGRAKCMKCGVMTCSVMCKDTHDEQRCLKFYA